MLNLDILSWIYAVPLVVECAARTCNSLIHFKPRMFVVIKTGAKLCMLADIMQRRGTLVGVDVAPVILHGAVINIESVNASAWFGLETNFLCCLSGIMFLEATVESVQINSSQA